MKALSATIVIHVSDLNRAISYYTAVLGFGVNFEFGEYVGLTYDDVSVQLSGPTYAGQKKLPAMPIFIFIVMILMPITT